MPKYSFIWRSRNTVSEIGCIPDALLHRTALCCQPTEELVCSQLQYNVTVVQLKGWMQGWAAVGILQRGNAARLTDWQKKDFCTKSSNKPSLQNRKLGFPILWYYLIWKQSDLKNNKKEDPTPKYSHREYKMQFFYTDRIFQTRFYP